MVARLSGMNVPKNKAVIGGNAYAHESGIHQDGVLKNPETYEIITPQLVGVKTNALPLGKLSGRHAFATKMQELGYQLSNEEIKELFATFKQLADKKKQVTDADLIAIVADQLRQESNECQLKTLQLQYVSNGLQGAIVSIEDEQGQVHTASAIGPGSIQGIYNAIDQIYQQKPLLTSYEISAITSGEDAQAEVYVTLETENQAEQASGVGIDFDVLQASAKAYIQASTQLKKSEGNK